MIDFSKVHKNWAISLDRIDEDWSKLEPYELPYYGSCRRTKSLSVV